MRYIAIDTETTGFSQAEPVEIAAQDLESKTWFCEKIKPSKPIEPGATAVHGISNEVVVDCRSTRDVLQSFMQFCSGGPVVLIAHNAPFDKRVLENAFRIAQLEMPPFQWICTMQMSKNRQPAKVVPHTNDKVSHTLQDCCGRANIEYLHGHSALPDAIMCAKLYKDFLEQDMQSEALQEVHAQGPIY